MEALLAELREENKQLSRWMRIDHDESATATATNLLIYGLHQAWVVERLISNSVSDVDDFYWRNQLKAFYDIATQQAYFMIRDMRMDYQYNYIGNSPNLVITELSEACYAYMFEARKFGKGFGAWGPLGTGKTETIKQLAHDLGIEAFAFTC